MPRQVRFDHYGGVDVLELVEVDKPQPGEGQLLVAVRAAGLNPFDSKLRRGQMQSAFSIEFPALQGTDLAGVVEAVGPGVGGFEVGDEIVASAGKRGAQADFALVSQTTALPRPLELPWELGGALWVAANTASTVANAVAVETGEVVLISGASGGVGGLVSQLMRRRGVQVIGVADEPSHDWLRSHGVLPITYGDGIGSRIDAAVAQVGRPVTAVLDVSGGGYVELGIGLGLPPERINTIVDFAAAKQFGVKTDGGGVASAQDVRVVLELLAAGELDFQIHRTYPLDQVRQAYTELEEGHPRGKIVLVP